MRRTLSAILLAALTGPFFACLAMAAPAGRMAPIEAESLAFAVEKVHGCHFDMGPGMAPDYENGPHYHDRQCRVVPTGPPRRGYDRRSYDDSPGGRWRERYDYVAPPQQPICTERCRYIGPIKRCRTVCD